MDRTALITGYCKRGDEAAFRCFFDHQAPRLWRFLVAKGATAEDANDIVAEAFCRFVDRVCKDPSSPVAFLYRIALNLYSDEHRRQRLAVKLMRDFEQPPDAGDDAPLRAEALDLLAHLDPHEQNLLLLRYWIGMTHREIAGVVGLPEGTVRRQAAAALKQLKTLAEDIPCRNVTSAP